MHDSKFWINVARVDNAYGDRNLIPTYALARYEEALYRFGGRRSDGLRQGARENSQGLRMARRRREYHRANLTSGLSKWHAHGVDGMCYNAGHDTEKIQRAAKAAHANGMEYHAWIPAMLQHGLDSTLYAVNRKGESAYSYRLCPLLQMPVPEPRRYGGVLAGSIWQGSRYPGGGLYPSGYIRYVDVILARGLWEKYGLVMDEEYPTADYCYCDKCVADFKAATGIDIKSVEDPSKCAEWAQFRCDLITKLVNRIADEVHGKGKKVSAAVFPGPDSHAKWMVRQEWNKWNIDAFFPMNYNDFYLEDASWLAPIVKEEVAAVQGKKPVYSGLFICEDWQNKANIKDPEGHGLIPSEIEEAVRAPWRTERPAWRCLRRAT